MLKFESIIQCEFSEVFVLHVFGACLYEKILVNYILLLNFFVFIIFRLKLYM